MSDSATAQYADRPLPEHLTVPGWRVAVIVSSFAVALPAFLNGADTGLALGFWNAVLASIAAGLILAVGGYLTSLISVRTRLTTYLLVQRSFGRFGAALVNIVIALVLFGWFGVNVSFFGSAMVAAAKQRYGIDGHFAAYVIGGSILMTASTVFGFRTLDKLAAVTVPLLGIVLLAVCVMAVRRHGFVLTASPNPPVPMSFGIALSALVGGNMATVATMPDLSRYTSTTRGAFASMALSFPLATPVMMIASALPGLATNQTDIMVLIVGLGFGIPALAALVLSTWVINASNLYSAGLSLSATFPAMRSWMFVLLGGVIGTGFALAGIIDQFIPFLLFLGIIIPPIAAIYVIDSFFLFRGADAAASIRGLPAMRWPAVGTWIGSVALVLITSRLGVSMTGVPMFDATIVAAAGYAIVLRLHPRGLTPETSSAEA
ncbi:MAG TPA: cytosine permease [Sphingomonas sp.]|nr:cytosine permease [Sphingomonas sp.]